MPLTAQTMRRICLLLSAAIVLLTTAPARTGRSKSRDYVAEARRIAEQQVERLGDGYEARIDHARHIVYVSALDARHLQKTVDLVSSYVDAQRRTLLSEPLIWNVTVVLPTVADYRELTPDERMIGFYDARTRRLTSIDRGRVLLHEFTHALHHADMAARKQLHPGWVCEGLATLFESSEITLSGLEPGVCPRLALLRRNLKQDKFIELERFCKMSIESFVDEAEVAYPQARYLMLYLYEKGRLKQWYDRYTRTYTSDPGGSEALEWATGKRLDRLGKAWQRWVDDLEYDDAKGRRQQRATLGLQFQDTREGVKAVGVLDDSAAQHADRLRAGDLILTYNGVEVLNAAHLASLIRNTGAHRTVEIGVKRGGRPVRIRQTLAAPDD